MDKDEFLARASRPAEEALRVHPFYRGNFPGWTSGTSHPLGAAAAAVQAQAEGVARIVSSRDEIRARAAQTMRNARETTPLLMREGLIPEPPKGA